MNPTTTVSACCYSHDRTCGQLGFYCCDDCPNHPYNTPTNPPTETVSKYSKKGKYLGEVGDVFNVCLPECEHLHPRQLLSSSENEKWICDDCKEPIPAPEPTVTTPTETVSDYKNKEESMSKNTMLDPKKGWVPAIEEPYYPSLLEKIKHFLGIHCWTITPKPRTCVMCGKVEEL